MDEEGSEIFEITDFTTATEFERFVSRLEEVIHEWKLTQEPFDFSSLPAESDVNTQEWLDCSDEISYIDYPFIVTRYYLKPPRQSKPAKPSESDYSSTSAASSADRKESWSTSLRSMHSNKYDFPAKAHCLCRWYGLTDFVVISPKSFSLTSQDKINSVQSAIRVATHNSGCAVPVFLQALEDWRKFYVGYCSTSGSETCFEMVHLAHIPDKYRHLTGLLDVFKSKLNITADVQSKVNVSMRFTYILQEWEEYMFDWPQASSENGESVESSSIGITTVDKLPFGACDDPISELYLFATWLNMSEDVVTESAVYSDLDPLQAPLWTVRVTLSPNTQGLLGDCLTKFMDLCGRYETFEQVLGRRIFATEDQDDGVQISNALERLTSPQTQYSIPSLAKVSKAVRSTRLRLSAANNESPIPTDVLNKILFHIFPDANDVSSDDNEKSVVSDDQAESHKEMFKFYKTAPMDSPLYKLAVCCCLVNYAFGGLKAVAHLWHEFVLEMRYRLENSVLIPGLEKGNPNLALGIMYQKLQMLNCCIEKKIQRDQDMVKSQHTAGPSDEHVKVEKADQSESLPGDDSTQDDAVLSGDSDDEFYECDTEERASDPQLSDKTNNESLYEDSVSYQPQGRLHPLEELRLLNKPEEPLYVPVTQEPAPLTEDLLAEHAEILTRLGTSAEGASLRARMQSASLLSDMESFKAANPGCVLEDFVRWYSPRDYIIQPCIDKDTGETVEKGALSERMSVPGNMWQEVWDSAKPIPAYRQKRLFDDTKEAEKVLHFLANLTPAQVVLHLLPLACQSALLIVKSQNESILLPTVNELLDTLTTSLEKKTRLASQAAHLYSDTVSQLKTAELVIARARSLHLKFACDGVNKANDHIRSFVFELMEQEEVKVIGAARGPVGKSIYKMFADVKAMMASESESDSAQLKPEDLDLDSRDADSVFPSPAAKEYILRTTDPRPAPYSQTLPHRMYCTLVSGTEYRLAGAFSSDVVFH